MVNKGDPSKSKYNNLEKIIADKEFPVQQNHKSQQVMLPNFEKCLFSRLTWQHVIPILEVHNNKVELEIETQNAVYRRWSTKMGKKNNRVKLGITLPIYFHYILISKVGMRHYQSLDSATSRISHDDHMNLDIIWIIKWQGYKTLSTTMQKLTSAMSTQFNVQYLNFKAWD